MQPNHEIRSMRATITPAGEAGKQTLTGMIPFNSPSQMLCEGGVAFNETIAPNAFNFASDVRALINHESYPVLGRLANSTLKLEQKADGLYVTVLLPPTQAAEDLYVSVQRGDIAGMSFQFWCNADGERWDYSGDIPQRTLHSITIDEVSFVGQPAYSDTQAAARSIEKYQNEKRETAKQAESTNKAAIEAELMLALAEISLQEQQF